MSIKEKVLDEMHKPELYLKKVVPFIDNNAQFAFSIAASADMSINEWIQIRDIETNWLKRQFYSQSKCLIYGKRL